MAVGAIISAARKRAGLSQKDLAARILKEDGIPISPPYLNDIERDRRNPPSPYLLKQFAAILNLSYEYLLFAADEFPDDLRGSGTSYPPERVEAAFAAFRRVLNEK
jgi:transcriptional regulator with XRE-family HTH domain